LHQSQHSSITWQQDQQEKEEQQQEEELASEKKEPGVALPMSGSQEQQLQVWLHQYS